MIFIDIDDTLILWRDHRKPHTDEYDWNNPLITKLALMHGGTPWILWSGGGRDYALTWMRRLSARHPRMLDGVVIDVIALDPSIPLLGDICIDDMALARSHGPCIVNQSSGGVLGGIGSCGKPYADHNKDTHDWMGWKSPAEWLTPNEFIGRND